jgi:hypothetical protein
MKEGVVERGTPHLQPAQEALLTALVEAARTSPREPFMALQMQQGDIFIHPSLPRDFDFYWGDLLTLATAGLFVIRRHDSSGLVFDVAPAGFAAYEAIHTMRAQPADRIEAVIRRLINEDSFRRRHPSAFGKWVEAEGRLWGERSVAASTQLGHSVREALQDFVDDMVREAAVRQRCAGVLKAIRQRVPAYAMPCAMCTTSLALYSISRVLGLYRQAQL